MSLPRIYSHLLQIFYSSLRAPKFIVLSFLLLLLRTENLKIEKLRFLCKERLIETVAKEEHEEEDWTEIGLGGSRTNRTNWPETGGAAAVRQLGGLANKWAIKDWKIGVVRTSAKKIFIVTWNYLQNIRQLIN